jgi:Uncharacterized conserved protein
MYFEKSGKENTESVIREALKAAREKNINHIIVASNTGCTADYLKNCGLNVVVVIHANGFVEKGKNEMSRDKRAELIESGMQVITGTHVLSGAERSLSRRFGGINPVEVIAYTLRMFGQGVKVGVEISTMALDAGAIPYGEEVIAIGGTGRGADSAIIIKPEHANDILNTKICEIICKPRHF